MDEQIKDHWDSRASGYSKSVCRRHDDVEENSGWIKLYSDAIGFNKGKALDCGCGPGTVSLRISEIGFSVTAFDFSEKMLEQAKQNMLNYGYQAVYIQGDAENLPFEDCSFDLVVSQYLLWTVPHPEKVIEEWYRVLRPGGRLVFVDGVWDNSRNNTLYRRFVQKVAKKFYKMEKIPEDSFDRTKLWSYSAKRPQADFKMLERAGFLHISLREDIARQVMPRDQYYATAYTREYFLVSADKP